MPGGPETLTGNAYLDSHPHGSDDQLLRTTTAPSTQHMVAAAVCATIDAEPTEPGPVHAPGGVPQLPPAVDLPGTIPSPSVVPSLSLSVAPSPTGPAASPSLSSAPGRPTPGTSGAPSTGPSSPTSPTRPQPEPQPPSVTIGLPASGGTLRRGCEERFSGTARTRPGNQPITDPQAATWQLIGPNGAVVLGHGTTATFTVPLLADGSYPLVLTVRDPANGRTGQAQVSVRITGCLR